MPFHCYEFTVTEECKFEPYIQSREYYLQNLQVNLDTLRVGNTASFAHVLVGSKICLTHYQYHFCGVCVVLLRDACCIQVYTISNGNHPKCSSF